MKSELVYIFLTLKPNLDMVDCLTLDKMIQIDKWNQTAATSLYKHLSI